MTSEKLLEAKLREAVKRKGGKAWKWVSPGITGVPDRIITMPEGKVFFVEVKTTGKKQSHRQEIVAGELGKLGHRIWIVDSIETLNEFIKQL